jgi:hypothetical protein
MVHSVEQVPPPSLSGIAFGSKRIRHPIWYAEQCIISRDACFDISTRTTFQSEAVNLCVTGLCIYRTQIRAGRSERMIQELYSALSNSNNDF